MVGGLSTLHAHRLLLLLLNLGERLHLAHLLLGVHGLVLLGLGRLVHHH